MMSQKEEEPGVGKDWRDRKEGGKGESIPGASKQLALLAFKSGRAWFSALADIMTHDTITWAHTKIFFYYCKIL